MNKSAILAIILTSYFLIILDVSIVYTGLPAIERDLMFAPERLAWIQSVYTLTFGGGLLLGARAGDLFGHRIMFQIGLTIFAVSSVLIGASSTDVLMIAGRAVQGLGAAILAPTTIAMLAVTFAEGAERDRATSAYGAMAGIGASVSMVLGGVFADLLNWRFGFFINLPISVILFLASMKYLPKTRPERGRFDVAGAVMSTLGLALLLLAADEGGGGWSLKNWACLAGGALLLLLFIRHEARTPQPLMPLSIFADPVRAGACLARFLVMGATVTYFFFMTQVLQSQFGYSAIATGMWFLPMTLTNFAVALYAPRMGVTPRVRLVIGLSFNIIGLLWLSQLAAGQASGILIPMILIGLANGFAFSPLTSLALTNVAPKESGAAAGIINVAHQIGSSLGLAFTSAVAMAAGGHSFAGDGVRSQAAFLAATVLCVLALLAVMALMFGRRGRLLRLRN